MYSWHGRQARESLHWHRFVGLDLVGLDLVGHREGPHVPGICSFIIQVSKALVLLPPHWLPQPTINTAARGILLKPESDHVTPLLHTLPQVLIVTQSKGKVFTIALKAFLDLTYPLLLHLQLLLLLLSTSLTPLGPHWSSCWSQNTPSTHPSPVFSFAVSSAWNSLPSDFLTVPSLTFYKSLPRSHLLSVAYLDHHILTSNPLLIHTLRFSLSYFVSHSSLSLFNIPDYFSLLFYCISSLLECKL